MDNSFIFNMDTNFMVIINSFISIYISCMYITSIIHENKIHDDYSSLMIKYSILHHENEVLKNNISDLNQYIADNSTCDCTEAINQIIKDDKCDNISPGNDISQTISERECFRTNTVSVLNNYEDSIIENKNIDDDESKYELDNNSMDGSMILVRNNFLPI